MNFLQSKQIAKYLGGLLVAITCISAHALTKQDVAKKFGVNTSNMTLSAAPAFSGKFYALADETGNTIFVSEDLRYAVSGAVLDHKTGKNLSAQAAAKPTKFIFSDLDLSDAIKIGSGATKLIVFADPKCGYCKKLERELDGAREHFTVYVVLLPILGQASLDDAQNIWCSADPAAAWLDAMHDKPIVKAEACTVPFEKNLTLAKKYGITGTPTIVLPDGKIIPGFVPVSTLIQQTGGQQ